VSKLLPTLFALKGEARSLQTLLSAAQGRQITLSYAQQRLAATYGYGDWQALRAAAITQHACTPSGNALNQWPLPAEVTRFLDHRARNTRLHPDTVGAASSGIVFVYDRKEATHFHVDDVAVSDDDLHYACAPQIAPTMWSAAMNSWVAAASELPDTRPFAIERKRRPFSDLDPVGLMTESILDDLSFFRYAGTDSLATFEQAYGFALSRCRFHPLYVILRGRAFDCSAIPKIFVDGVVVRCNVPG
jgi:hypothetical protein